jgi:Ca2+-binding RTX toxin-like protein
VLFEVDDELEVVGVLGADELQVGELVVGELVVGGAVGDLLVGGAVGDLLVGGAVGDLLVGGAVGDLLVGGAVGDLRVVGVEWAAGELLQVAYELEAGAEYGATCAGLAEWDWADGLLPDGVETGRDEDAAGPEEGTVVVCTTAAGCSVWVTCGWLPDPPSTSAAAAPPPTKAAAIVLTASASPRRGRRRPGRDGCDGGPWYGGCEPEPAGGASSRDSDPGRLAARVGTDAGSAPAPGPVVLAAPAMLAAALAAPPAAPTRPAAAIAAEDRVPAAGALAAGALAADALAAGALAAGALGDDHGLAAGWL